MLAGLLCITFSWRDFFIQLTGFKRGLLIPEVWLRVQWWFSNLQKQHSLFKYFLVNQKKGVIISYCSQVWMFIILLHSGWIHCWARRSAFHEYPCRSSHCRSCSHRSWRCIWAGPYAENSRKGLFISIWSTSVLLDEVSYKYIIIKKS